MRQATCLAVALLLAAGAAPAAETGYPSKPIRFLVGFPPGGGNDTMARLFGQKMSDRLGRPLGLLGG